MGEDDSELILQMDIEGAEYQCINGTPTEVFERFRIMVIEFHDLHKLRKRKYRKKYIEVFRKLSTSHHCVHIHPNNNCKVLIKDDMVIPSIMEFTFLRKDRSKKHIFRVDFPHPLDFDNVPKPTLVLPEIWYKHA